MIRKFATLAALAAVAGSWPAHAAVVISNAATQNMSCSGGTCIPTAAKAVLNATDLQNDISQFGDVSVATTGSGVEAENIIVKAPFSSPDSTSLTLHAHKAITVDTGISIGSGTAELELQSDTGGQTGTISFGSNGYITFGSLSDIFGINGGIFTLVGSVQGLASAVAANHSGAFALANSYDASQDGTYTQAPVQTKLTGSFEGLGNTISNLAIESEQGSSYLGLFAMVTGTIDDVRLAQANIFGVKSRLGGLAAYSEGTLLRDSVTGEIQAGGRKETFAGGVVGENLGIVEECYSNADITVPDSSLAGGLVGYNYYDQVHPNQISSSYATGSVAGNDHSFLGGLIGDNHGSVEDSYATGPVSTNEGTTAGGFVGDDPSPGDISDSYWDTDTSGITNFSQGAGYPSDDPGITGLTTQQLQSGLPKGFNRKIWAEDAKINNGLPYLIANPPPK